MATTVSFERSSKSVELDGEMLKERVGRFVILSITDTVNCSFRIYIGGGARLCQKQSVVRFSEHTSITSKLYNWN